VVVVGALVAASCGSSGDGADATGTTAPTATTELGRSSAPDGTLPDATQADLQAALDQAMATYDVPGAVVGVYVPGHGSWVSVTGVADTATQAPVSADETWPLRSITKSFTVTLVLQLVDDGELSLDDTVGQYVDGVPNGDRITIRELANMTSGLAEYTNEAFIDDFVADPTRVFTLDELNAYAFADPPQFEPGAEHVYTNTNTNVLGSVVEAVTGQPFDQVLEERILRPLGLDATAYLADGSPWAEPHATGYQPDDGTLAEQPENFTVFGPAGAMVTTLDDERVWAEALAEGTLLQPATQAARLEGAPLEKGPEYDQYALGIGEIEGWWGHTGEGFGFTALTMHDPESGATVVIFMNLASTPDKSHPPTKLFRQMVPIIDALG
jgi:D-alanyl-D-alanine carboxypeptidase